MTRLNCKIRIGIRSRSSTNSAPYRGCAKSVSTTAFVAMALLNLMAAADMWRIGNYGLTVVFVSYAIASIAYIYGVSD